MDYVPVRLVESNVLVPVRWYWPTAAGPGEACEWVGYVDGLGWVRVVAFAA